jgi:hypothetical protein
MATAAVGAEMRKPAAGLLIPLVVAVSLSGCASDTTATLRQPTCPVEGDDPASNAVVLMAQSVPTASWVPCLRPDILPGGWSYEALDVRNNVSRFWLTSDRDGERAIEVRLEKSCTTAGTTEIPTDRDGMRRYERVTETDPEYHGKRYYVFDGGCLTFVFKLTGKPGQTRGEPLALATQAVSTVSRADLAAQVLEESDGRLHLDPPEESR